MLSVEYRMTFSEDRESGSQKVFSGQIIKGICRLSLQIFGKINLLKNRRLLVYLVTELHVRSHRQRLCLNIALAVLIALSLLS